MHLEILVEDISGRTLLEAVVPKILGSYAEPHTWRIIAYKGVGKLPTGLRSATDPAKRVLLDRLPALLRGYGRTPGIDAVMIVVDSDRRDCSQFLSELSGLVTVINPCPTVLFRLAIEEIEAWYFGDRAALLSAYPRARREVLGRYVQDSICDTWETLADAIHPGGSAEIKRVGYPYAGAVKHTWAVRIAPLMDTSANTSPSFRKLREGLARLSGRPSGAVEGA